MATALPRLTIGRAGCVAALSLVLGLARPALAQLPAPATVALTVPAGLANSPFEVARSLQVPAGFAIEVYARMSGARFMAIAPDGSLASRAWAAARTSCGCRARVSTRYCG